MTSSGRIHTAAAFVFLCALLAVAGVSGAAGLPEPDDRVVVEVQVPAPYKVWPFDEPRTLKVPPGYDVSVFAAGLGRPRFMALAPDGAVYVSVPREDRILVLPDEDRDGVADRVEVFAEGLWRPHGLAFKGRELIVAEGGRLISLEDTDGDYKADAREVITEDVPSGGGHWTRSVAIGPDGRYYVSAGSTCNACVEKDFRRASVLWFWPGGGEANVFASGLRNTVGLEFHPETGELWGVDNGRDWLGDDLPPEELNRILAGNDYGWPYCYGDRVPDPDHGSKKRCAATIPPELEMQAHSAPLGLAFGYGLEFPVPMRHVLYIAFHGSWNRSRPTGYKVVGVPFAEGRPSGEPFDFVSGWLVDTEVWGRPVDVLAGPDGAMYVTDDFGGAVYRIVPFRETALTVGPAGGI